MKTIINKLTQLLGGHKNVLLLSAVAILFTMVGFRMLYSGKLYYLFLIWNTFLAVVPFVISEVMEKNNFSKFKNVVLAIVCVLFLPNALYLISDFEHLAERPPVPFFYDILLMFYAALLGLLFNILALRNLHNVAIRFITPKSANRWIAFIIFLSGFGVYLGRYLRWNSWDIVTNPVPLLTDCVQRICMPHVYYYTWAVSLGYAFVLGFGYLVYSSSIKNN